MLREEQEPPCETSAEQYQPTSVDTVLGNPTVTLTHEDLETGKLEKVKRAPTAGDIAGLRDGYYLDLEGEALGDTCIYAKDFAKLVEEGKAPAIIYAHIAREPNHPGFVLQYWFFWYFNQFNDLHEGDWEGMQVSFEAETPVEALREEPHEIIVFQHAGGERAGWGDSKVQKEGTHPIVYPAAGSHATFYDSAVYIQNGQRGSGVGCDNTTEPLRELRLRPVLLPEPPPNRGRSSGSATTGAGAKGKRASTTARPGRRRRRSGRNRSPGWPTSARPARTCPAARSPARRSPGCSAALSPRPRTSSTSRRSPGPWRSARWSVLGLLIALFIGLTHWRPVDLTELRAKRAFGQLVRTARQLYGRHWRVLVTVALAGLVIVAGTNLLASLLAGGSSADQAAGRSGVNLALADLVESIARPIALAVVAAIVIIFMRLLVECRPAGFRECWSGMRKRFWRVVGALLLAILGIALMAITVVGLPFAIWKTSAGHSSGRKCCSPTSRCVRPSAAAPTWSAGAGGSGPGRRLPGRDPLRRRPGPDPGADLHPAAVPGDQPARGADLLPADPLRGDRPDPALLRPAGAGRGRAGEAAALLAALAPAPVRPRRHRTGPAGGHERIGSPL